MNTTQGLQTLIDHFKQQNWRFQVDESRSILHAMFSLRNGDFHSVAAVDESNELLQFRSVLPVVVPPEKRAAVAELCLRISHRLKLGKVDLDFDDGKLRVHTTAAYPNGQLPDGVIRHVVGANLIIADMHFPVFMRVLYGDQSPLEALRQVERRAARVFEDQQPPCVPLPQSRIAFN